MKVNPYLNYGGNCEQAFRFYEQHLGGKLIAMMTHAQAPGATNVVLRDKFGTSLMIIHQRPMPA